MCTSLAKLCFVTLQGRSLRFSGYQIAHTLAGMRSCRFHKHERELATERHTNIVIFTGLFITRASSPGAYGDTGEREEERPGAACCSIPDWSPVVSIWIARGGWNTKSLTEQSTRGDGKE